MCVCVAANRQLAVDKMATRRALLRRWMMYAWNFVRATRRAWPLCALFRHSHKLSLLYAVVALSRFFFPLFISACVRLQSQLGRSKDFEIVFVVFDHKNTLDDVLFSLGELTKLKI